MTVRRRHHDKSHQGRLSGANVAFGLRYIGVACWSILRLRPRVLYLDVPKDAPSFLRTSPILLLAFALRTRVIGDLAGADFAFLDRGRMMRRIGGALLRRLYCIRVLGDSIAATLANRGIRNTTVLSNGVPDPGPPEPRGFPDRETQLLYVGTIAISKGILISLETLASLGDGFHLHVVGEWESAETRRVVLAQIAKARLDDSVTFHGVLEGDAKWACFRNAHLLVHPSRWDGQPITILEAFAAGLPVVASRVGAIEDTVRDGIDGRLLDAPTPEQARAGILALLEDAVTYETASMAARRGYEARFSEQQFVAAMARLMEGAAA